MGGISVNKFGSDNYVENFADCCQGQGQDDQEVHLPRALYTLHIAACMPFHPSCFWQQESASLHVNGQEARMYPCPSSNMVIVAGMMTGRIVG